MSTSRASSLASAALASSRSAKTHPKAPGLPTSSFLWPQSRTKKGKARQEEEYEEEDYEDDSSNLSSRQKRLSRAARFGSSNSSSPVSLPSVWNKIVSSRVEQADKKLLRQDFKNRHDPDGNNRIVKDPVRASILHLTTTAPYRYTSIYSALRQVRRKLGPDEEGSGVEGDDSWTPSRIVEYNCASGEGLWAAVEVFGNREKDGKGISEYVGYESRPAFYKSGMDILQEASKQSTESSGGEETKQESTKDEGSDMSDLLPLKGIKAKIGLFFPKDGEIDQTTSPSLTSKRDTLVICSFSLLKNLSDDRRLTFVKSIWKTHPSAEAIVFIEGSNERGFAAIASAREALLGLDLRERNGEDLENAWKVGGHVFYEQGKIDSQEQDQEQDPSNQVPLNSSPDQVECHVVAPCAHDKPCPLLHDYAFLGPANMPTTRTSRASSPLFHGATLGMNTCSFPQRMHVPDYTRKTNLQNRADESSRYSYLVVRRGPRPSIAEMARIKSTEQGQEVAQRDHLRKQAEKTKKGDIEELRAGSKRDSVSIGEEVMEGDAEGGTAMTADDLNENLAKEELMKLLPEALRSEFEAAKVGGEEEAEMEEAVRLAHEMMKKSANLLDDAEGKDDNKSDEKDNDLHLASAFLDQALSMKEGQQDTPSKEPLNAEDFEAMRVESYQWPRLVQSALKKSGHVTFDVCSCNGSIDRFTLSKSSGKQVYQDCRKSNWGDSLPHVPFSDEEGITASIKSLVVRVPPASDIRGNLPATFKPIQRKHKDIEKQKKMSLTSAQAISPDRIVGTNLKSENTSKTFDSTRRGHYEGARSNERRLNRKRSLGYYDKAIQEAQDTWNE